MACSYPQQALGPRCLALLLLVLAVGCGRGPAEAERLVRRAGMQLEEGAPGEARILADQALALAPGSALVQEVAGQVALRQGRAREAIEHFRKAVHLADQPRRRGLLAGAFLAAGRLDDASDTLDDALAQDAYDPALLRQAAYVYALTGRSAKAVEIAENALRLEPGNPPTMVRAASAFLRAGDRSRAETLLRSLKPSSLDRAEDLVILGAVLYELEDGRRAVESYRRAAEIHPDDPDVLFNLGTAQVLAEDFRAAKKVFEKVLVILPGDAKSQGQLAYCLLRMGRRESAQKAIREALVKDPVDPVLRMLRREIDQAGGS